MKEPEQPYGYIDEDDYQKVMRQHFEELAERLANQVTPEFITWAEEQE